MVTKGAGILGAGLILAVSIAGAARADEVYRGLCDASAAVALDADHFVAADDERNALSVFKRGQGAAVRTVPVHEFLGTKSDKESDLEGAARVGDRIYWISSHGRNKKGELQPRRHRFFATQVVAGPSVAALGKAYEGLLDDLLADPKLASYGLAEGAKLAPEAKGSLNIEGLAAMPNGQLLIGFRNPKPQGQALVVPLENPGELVEGKRARFGAPLLIDLEGRGIRSLEALDGAYLIVAGPSGDDGDFALYRWAGPGGAKPVKLAADLAAINPEALFVMPESNEVRVLSDDGGVKVDGVDCKEAAVEKKSFRGRVITVPKS